MSKAIKLNGYFEKASDEIENSTFKKVKIKVHALGKNANGSNITKQAYEKALNSIYGVPIVALYDEDKTDTSGNDGDLTSHNQKIKKDKNGNYILYYDTVPLGFVSPETSVYEEEIMEDDEISKTYIVVDNVILWKRYESTQKIIEWLDNGTVPKVSMEIGEVEGVVSEDGYFQIDSFEYESICALGSNVQPCFPRAEIESFSKKEFTQLYKEMFEEYSKSTLNQSSTDVDINKQKGGNGVGIEELLQKYNLTADQLDFSIDGLSIEEIESKIQEFVGKGKEEPKQDFALTSQQLTEELCNVLSEEKITDDWGWSYSRYSYVDNTENEVYAYDRGDKRRLYGFEYSMDGDKPMVKWDTKKRKKFQIVDLEEGSSDLEFEMYSKDEVESQIKFKEEKLKEDFAKEKETAVKDVQVKLDEVNEKFTKVEPEFERLKKFETDTLAQIRNAEEEELFEKYSMLNGVEEFESIKDKSKEYSLVDLEKELALIYVRKNASFASVKQEKKPAKIKLEDNSDEKQDPYGGLFSKHLKK